MNDFPFSNYVPPKDIKEVKFSVNLDLNDHVRLLYWMRHFGSGQTRYRAPAARHAIQSFLDSQGIPSASQIISSTTPQGPHRRRAVDRLLDEFGVPSAAEIEREYQLHHKERSVDVG